MSLKDKLFPGHEKEPVLYSVHARTYTVVTLVHIACGHFHQVTWPFLALLSFAEPLPSPNPRSRFFLMQINGMSFGWPECGQPAQPLIPATIMGSKGPSQSSVFQPGIPLLYWAACIWSLSPTEKLPPLSQEPPQHPVLSAHKCAQKPVLHVVAIYYRRGPQEG